MKNIKYTPLITLTLFILCCLSCKDEEIDGPKCCLPPPTLSLHIADIEGVGTSEKARKDFLSKVSIYYFSKTGVKKTFPLTGTRYQGGTYTEFSEVKKLILIKNQNECEFNVENCLSLNLLPLYTFWGLDSRKKTKRFYLQINQDVDKIDLVVDFPEGSIKNVLITNIQVNGKNMSPVKPTGDNHYYEYYFSKADKKPKVACPSE